MTNHTSPQRNKAEMQDVYKAATLAAEWQEVWKGFQEDPTPALARSVVAKGNDLLAEQDRLQLKMQPTSYVKHRVLVAEDYLAKEAKLWKTYSLSPSFDTQKIQKMFDSLKGKGK